MTVGDWKGPGVSENMRVLYVGALLNESAVMQGDALAGVHFRESVKLTPPPLKRGAVSARGAVNEACNGLVLAMARGIPNRRQLAFARKSLRQGLATWFHRPLENIVEPLNEERLQSYLWQWRLAACVVVLRVGWRFLKLFSALVRFDVRARRDMADALIDAWYWIILLGLGRDTDADLLETPAKIFRTQARIGQLGKAPRPNSLSVRDQPPTAEAPIDGAGVYLRLDFWAPMSAGGSYAHTSYVAKELAAVSERFVCFMANRFELLDQFGIEQHTLNPPRSGPVEESIVVATGHYLKLLEPEIERLKPAYIYERYCLGNFAGAELSAKFGVPYILEYNGSEISLSKSFSGRGYVFEDLYREAEEFSLRQASLVTVVSQVLRDQLVSRRIDPEKILVNPNGADPEAYQPPTEEEKSVIRRRFGWDESHLVIGFIGSFGGWHGIETLARAIPAIAGKRPDARFLLVGDGDRRPLLEKAIGMAELEDRVEMTGMVKQEEAGRQMAACDIFLSPHDSHMVDSPFIGSPTKLFEYMAFGGAIVASDLEQIGAVLWPALSNEELCEGGPDNGPWRGVLCPPGDENAIAEAVNALAERPDLRRCLGKNARNALLEDFTWNRYVQRLWTRREVSALKVKRRPAPAGRVKDMMPGCDSGEMSDDRNEPRDGDDSWLSQVFAAAELPEHDVLDISPVAEAEAEKAVQAGLGHGVSVTRAVDGTGGLSDNRFDLVYGIGALSNGLTVDGFADEAFRLLRPGGRLVLIEMAQHSAYFWYHQVLWRGLRWAWAYHKSIGTLLEETEDAFPLAGGPVKRVFSVTDLKGLLGRFKKFKAVKKHLDRDSLPGILKGLSEERAGKYLVVTAWKPRVAS